MPKIPTKKPSDKLAGIAPSDMHGETSTAPARVRISKGVTKNMGDYNSARVDVAIEMDVTADASVLKAITITIERINTLVDDELTKQVSDLDL